MINAIYSEIKEWLEAIINSLPGEIGLKIRQSWYRNRLSGINSITIGTGCKIQSLPNIRLKGNILIGNNSFFTADGGFISIGQETAFNTNVHINASGGGQIQIGDYCLIGPNVVMRTAGHQFSNPDIPIKQQGHSIGDIIIEDDVWIGSNAIILGNVTIGKGSVIGAGAVVTKNIPPMSVAVGIPAKVIKKRNK